MHRSTRYRRPGHVGQPIVCQRIEPEDGESDIETITDIYLQLLIYAVVQVLNRAAKYTGAQDTEELKMWNNTLYARE